VKTHVAEVKGRLQKVESNTVDMKVNMGDLKER